MKTNPTRGYDPRAFKALTFHDATPSFRNGSDTPRAYLERCIATIAEREPVVKAFVTLKPGASADEAQLIAHARNALAHFKAPKKIVFGDLPKNATGKIQKFVLRERAKELLKG